ncbi:hypothetical protein NQ318_015060 [Aromia moschata]|uniref:acid phosphatase n=1 Tax=Aromia moschata TaxID=1265417 RepID=A0AAV8YXP4_9CUCU|nr:hypothetical protein NQ318_015060 [Aromia moschata]
MYSLVGIGLVIFFIIRCDCFVLNSTGNGESELVSVAVLFRHGDKTPTTSFPNDPYFNLTYWPMGFGQLTKRGKMRQYELGKWLRNRYSSFLADEYFSKDIYVRSTDVDRTLMSASANLAGLYPPKDAQVWNKKLPWQPVPVHTIPKTEDQVLYMNSNCTRFSDLYKDQYDADFFKQVNEEYADFYEEVSNLTGWNITDVHFFAQLQSVLYVYDNYNRSYLPSWSSTLDMDKVNYLAGLNYARYTFTENLKKLGAGPFFDYLVTHFEKTSENDTATPKLLMLSGHESTLAAALNSMGVFDYKAPAFASCVVWELWRSDGGYYVNMYYKKNSDMEVPDKLQLKDCDFDCDLDRYKELLAPITLDKDEWEKEHGDKTPTISFPNDPFFLDMSNWEIGHGELTKRQNPLLRAGQVAAGPLRSLPVPLPLSERVLPPLHRHRSHPHVGGRHPRRPLPPPPDRLWNPDLLWDPLPVHSTTREHDRVLYLGRHGFGHDCDKFSKLFKEAVHGEFFRSINGQHANFYQELSKLTGWNVTDVMYMAWLQSALDAYASYDPSMLPEWARTLDYDKLNYLAAMNYARYTFTKDLKRLSAGPYLYYVWRHFEKFVNDKQDMPKFLMLVAHESTIAGILNAMDLFDYRVPQFGATVLFELRKDRKKYFVNILYLRTGDAGGEPQLLKLKNCATDCNIDDFTEIFRPLMLNSTSWQEECQQV